MSFNYFFNFITSYTESNFYDRFTLMFLVFVFFLLLHIYYSFIRVRVLGIVYFYIFFVIISKFLFIKRFFYFSSVEHVNNAALFITYKLLDKGYVEWLSYGLNKFIVRLRISDTSLIYHVFGRIIVMATFVLLLIDVDYFGFFN